MARAACFEQFKADVNLVNLAIAMPSNKALRLTCKQINSEARGLYLEAYKTYWRTSCFTLDLTFGNKINVESLRRLDLDKSTSLKLTQTRDLVGGFWACNVVDPMGV